MQINKYVEALGKSYSELLSNKIIGRLSMPAEKLAEVTRMQNNKNMEVLFGPYGELLSTKEAYSGVVNNEPTTR